MPRSAGILALEAGNRELKRAKEIPLAPYRYAGDLGWVQNAGLSGSTNRVQETLRTSGDRIRRSHRRPCDD